MTPNQLSWIANLASDSVSTQELTARYHNLALGQPVHILGCGPSGADFVPPDGEHCIILNESVKRFLGDSPNAAYLHWMTSENRAFAFAQFWGNERFPGAILAEKYMARWLPQEYIGGYERTFWERFVWFERVQWEGQDLSDWLGQAGSYGLAYVSGCFDPVGSVLLQAIHLAIYMGASEIHLHGCELSFPSPEVQHASGWAPYELAPDSVYTNDTTEDQTKVAKCSITREGDAVLDPRGELWSTPYFIKSANAIRLVMSKQDVQLINHSGGLLDAAAPKPKRKGAKTC
jgi:hypothetical protein